jgi:Tol biopolymer transport system component
LGRGRSWKAWSLLYEFGGVYIEGFGELANRTEMRLSMVTLDIGNRTGANARLLRQLLLREKLSSAELSQPTFIGEKGIGYGDARYGDMFVINADGTSLTQLTNNAPVGENIAVSPDGKKIAFLGQAASNPRVKQRAIYDAYVINADGTGLTNLSDKVTRTNVTVEGTGLPLPSPSFSPDSKQIAFVSSTYVSPSGGPPYPPDDIDMYIVNVDGTGLTRLTNTETQEGILTWVWK